MNTSQLDTQIQTLHDNKDKWVKVSVAKRRQYLEQINQNILKVADEWVRRAREPRKLDYEYQDGDEWLAGPWATAHWIRGMIKTLKGIEAGKPGQLEESMVRTRANGQVVVDVLPLELTDHIFTSGFRAEVWMQPEVTKENLTDHIASSYQDPPKHGEVALVLGAGNITSIPILDVLYKLFAEQKVAILKMSPVNDYLGPCLETMFQPLVDDNFMRFAYGDNDVGAYLVDHDLVDTVHITGSINSFEAIVWGRGEEAEDRRKNRNPRLKKSITSELGNVSPTIVVPGPWEQPDIQYQAEHLAVQTWHNVGFDCLGTQIWVLPESWDQTDKLRQAVRDYIKTVPNRYSYFPDFDERHADLLSNFEDYDAFDDSGGKYLPRVIIPDIDPTDEDNIAFHREFFCNIVAETQLPGESAKAFLQNAIDFCNEKLHGTLSANIIIHPQTIKEIGQETLEEMIAQMEYGSIGVNLWTGGNFLLSQGTWGAYPGEDIYTAQSGIGIVHNVFLFDKPQKTVTYGGFYKFPRSILKGEIHILPKPVWFLDHERGHIAGKRVTNWTVNPSWLKVPGVVWAALRNR